MIATVLDYLKTDDELTSMLNHKKEFPKITAYHAHDRNAYPYIVINVLPYNIDILTGDYRCEVRIVTDDELLIEDLSEKVIDLLHFGNGTGYRKNNKVIFHSSFAGNGFLFDEKLKVYEQILNFTMTFNR